MKNLTAFLSAMLVCTWMVGCAPKADDAATTPAATETEGEHMEDDGHEHAEGESEGEVEGTTEEAPTEEAAPEEAAPEAGSAEN